MALVPAPSALRRLAGACALLCALLAAGVPWIVQPGWQWPAAGVLLVCAAGWTWLALRQGAGERGSHLPARSRPGTDADGELQREVQSLRDMQRELVEAKLAAEAATMAKGEFLATMSHEIRTPLNGILPLLDVVLSTALRDDQRDYIHTAHVSAQELLRIVDDILDYSKIEADRIELETVGINLRDLIEGVTSLLQRNASYKNLYLRTHIDRSVRLAVRGDPVRLRQVLTNLVSNAIKFTERGGILIDVRRVAETRTHHRLAFTVRDTGIGIAPEAREKIFQPFSQADTSTTRAFGGTGLGLVICKRLVELMDGSIDVESTLGNGSAFRFTVPLLKAPGDIRAHRNPSGIRTLALLSQPTLIRQSAMAMTRLGMSASHSRIPADALTALRTARGGGNATGYELLIVDADGFRTAVPALLRKLQTDPALRNLRVLTVGETAPADEAMGNLRHLRPPFDADAMRAVLADWFDGEDSGVPGSVPTTAIDGGSPPAPAIASSPPATPTQLHGHVLVVEDNPVNAAVAERLLSLLGLRVSAAQDGQQALDSLAREHFDLVLMDCQMPVMDGYTATRLQREREQTTGRHVPIIAMTANAMVGDREKCLASGMDDYLSKPLQRTSLASTLQRWLSTPAHETAAAPLAAPAPAPEPIAPTTPFSAAAAAAIPPATAQATPMPTPIAAAAAQQPALDDGVFDDLIDLMGDSLQEFIALYLADAPGHVTRLQAAIAARDADGAISAAHLLKSSSANLGALKLSQMVKQIEHDGRRGSFDFDPAKASAVAREFARAADELRRRSNTV